MAQRENIIIGPKVEKFSLLACFLFLIKDIKDGQKTTELLLEIRNMILDKAMDNTGFIKDYQNIKNKLKNTPVRGFKYDILIEEEDITKSIIRLLDYDKSYYLFDKTIRVQFNKNAKLFSYSNFMIQDYIKNRIIYLKTKNEIILLVDQLKEEIDNIKCNKTKDMITKAENYSTYKKFFNNLFNNIDKNFALPINLISAILQTNIIILNLDKDKTVDKIIEKDKKYKYILLAKKDKIFVPLYTKDKRYFYYKDALIKELLKEKPNSTEEVTVPDNRLEKIMQEIENPDEDDITNYVSRLGLDEA